MKKNSTPGATPNAVRGKRLYKSYKSRAFNISVADGASEKRGLFRIVTTDKEKVIKKKLFSLWPD